MKRVRMLIRVSTTKQENSITTQKKEIEAYVDSQKDWKLHDKKYIEYGVSGYTIPVEKRSELQRILRDAQKGEFDILVII